MATRRGPSKPRVPAPAGAEPTGGGRRLLVRAVALAVTLGLAWLLFLRPREPGQVSAEALRIADTVGCGQIERPATDAPPGQHLEEGEAHAYEDPPATSGPHDPVPLSDEPRVHAEPVSETRAVHNLEHAFVVVYYRPTGDGGPSAETVSALERYAESEDRVLMAPYGGLPAGSGLALLAWNTRWLCPSGLEPEQAVELARGFVEAYRGTNVAPEAPRGLLGPMFG